MRKIVLTAFILATLGAASNCASTFGVPGGRGGGGAEGNRRNPFLGVRFFLNPEYTASVEATAKNHPGEAVKIHKIAQYPTDI